MKIFVRESIRKNKKVNEFRFLHRSELPENYDEIITNIIRKPEKTEKEKQVITHVLELLQMCGFHEYETLEKTILKNLNFGFYRQGRVDCEIGYTTIYIENSHLIYQTGGNPIDFSDEKKEKFIPVVIKVVELFYMLMNIENDAPFNFSYTEKDEPTYSEEELSESFKPLNFEFVEVNDKYGIRFKEERCVLDFMIYPFNIKNVTPEMKAVVKKINTLNKAHRSFKSNYFEPSLDIVVNLHDLFLNNEIVIEEFDYVFTHGFYCKEDLPKIEEVLNLYDKLLKLMYDYHMGLKKECVTKTFTFEGI